MSDSNDSILDSLSVDAPRLRLRGADGSPALRRSGRFEVLGPIAEGGVGEVMKGRDVDLGREVAIKLLKERHADNADLVQRFVEEAQIEGQLQHPGIVPVYELGVQEDDRPFFAMKLVKGDTLAARFKQDEHKNRRELLSNFEQICQTVAYAHARGVVHRDLKPSNVMIGSFGEVQVLDWGFAKVLSRGGIADERPASPTPDFTAIATVRTEAEGSQSIPGSVMGTPAYMPPEQALGQVDSLDTRSDVFSLGAILCELLTGSPPYVGKPMDLLVQAAQADLDDALGRLDACKSDETLVALAKRCLEPKRSRRPRDAGVVATVVGDYLATVERRAHESAIASAEAKAVTKRAAAVTESQRKARRQTIALAAVLLVAVLGAGGVWMWTQRENQDRADRIASAVSAAIQDAQDRRGSKQWENARQAVGRARELDEDGRWNEELRTLVAAIDQESAADEAEVARKARDAALLRTLEDIQQSASVIGYPAAARETRQALSEYGIELDGAIGGVVTTIQRSSLKRRLTVVVNRVARWEFSYKRDHAEHVRLQAIAAKLETGPLQVRARDLLAREDYKGLRALAASDEAKEASVDAVVEFGWTLMQFGEFEAARTLLESTWLRRPDHFGLNTLLGRTYKFRQFLRQIRAYGATRLLDPEDSDADLAQSNRYLETANALRQGNASLWCSLADNYTKSGRPELAARAVRRAEKLAPESPYVRLAATRLRDANGRETAKLTDLEQLVSDFPDFAEARIALANLLMQRGKINLGLDAIRPLSELGNFQAYAISASAEAKRGNKAQALDRFLAAIAAVEGDHLESRHLRSVMLYRLARAAPSLGQADAIAPYYFAALREDPKFHFARNYLAYTLVAVVGDILEAEKQSKLALDAVPNQRLFHTIRGRVLAESFRERESIRHWEKALVEKRIPTAKLDYQASLAKALLHAGRIDEAHKAAANNPRAKKLNETIDLFQRWAADGGPKEADANHASAGYYYFVNKDIKTALATWSRVPSGAYGRSELIAAVRQGDLERALRVAERLVSELDGSAPKERRLLYGALLLAPQLEPLRDGDVPEPMRGQWREFWERIERLERELRPDYMDMSLKK